MEYELYHCRDARSFRVLWTLEELAVDYQLHSLEFPPRIKHPEFLETNPLGTVPVFKDNNLVMTESSAIVSYLVETHRSHLRVEIGQKGYADYLNWMYRSDATLTFPLTLVLRYSKFETGERLNPQVVEDYTRWFLSRAKSVERALENSDYLVNDQFSAADICNGYSLYFADLLGLSHKFGTKTSSYLNRLRERDAFKMALSKQGHLEFYL